MTDAIEIDRWTHEGHQRFKANQSFSVRVGGRNVLMNWNEWIEWQRTRNPINDDPETADIVRSQIAHERRGPGISRRK